MDQFLRGITCDGQIIHKEIRSHHIGTFVVRVKTSNMLNDIIQNKWRANITKQKCVITKTPDPIAVLKQKTKTILVTQQFESYL